MLGFDLDMIRPYFASMADRDAYFNKKGGIMGFGTYAWLNPGDPFVVNKYQDIVNRHTIGRYNVDPNLHPEYHEKYYFTIQRTEVIGDGKIKVYPVIDWELTHMIDYKEAHITRCPVDSKHAIANERGVTRYEISKYQKLLNQTTIGLVLSSMKKAPDEPDPEEGKPHSLMGPVFLLLDNHATSTHTLSDIISAALNLKLFTTTDIIGAYIVPDLVDVVKTPVWEPFPRPEIYERRYGISYNYRPGTFIKSDPQLINDHWTDYNRGRISGFSDARGNIVYTVPYGVDLASWEAYLQISGGGCTCYVTLETTKGGHRCDQALTEGLAFSIPCPTLDIANNTWLEYSYRQREIDLKSKELSYDKALTSSMVSTAIGVFTGTGLAGTIRSAAQGVADYYIDTIYGNKEQKIKDLKHILAQNPTQITGAGSAYDWNLPGGLYAFSLDADPVSMARINAENQTVGVSANGFVLNMKDTLKEDLTKGDNRPWAFMPLLSMAPYPEDQKAAIQSVCSKPHKWVRP